MILDDYKYMYWCLGNKKGEWLYSNNNFIDEHFGELVFRAIP